MTTPQIQLQTHPLDCDADYAKSGIEAWYTNHAPLDVSADDVDVQSSVKVIGQNQCVLTYTVPSTSAGARDISGTRKFTFARNVDDNMATIPWVVTVMGEHVATLP
jgi:hypothetical protein